MSPKWLDVETVLAVHDRQIADHGGMPGLRDTGLLRSAMARAEHLAACDEHGLFDLAAAYAWGIARHHPFHDGNKRTAYVSCMLFLRLHGIRIAADAAERVLLFERLGNGSLEQGELAGWLRGWAAAQAPASTART
jgi:death-on-curing protein